MDLSGLSVVEMDLTEKNSVKFAFEQKVFSLMGPHSSLTLCSPCSSPAPPFASPLLTCSIFSFLLGVGQSLELGLLCYFPVPWTYTNFRAG